MRSQGEKLIASRKDVRLVLKLRYKSQWSKNTIKSNTSYPCQPHQDLRPHFQSVLFFFFFPKMHTLTTTSHMGFMVPTLCGNLGFLFSLLTTSRSLNTSWTAPVTAGMLAEIILLCHSSTTHTSPLQVIFATVGSDFALLSLWCTVWGEHWREPSTAMWSSI